MPNDIEKNTGNLPSDLDRNVPPAFRITHKEYLRLVANAMWQEAGKAPGAAKRIAEKVECNDKTAQSWLDGKTTPANILEVRAMSRLPIYAALKRKLAAQESSLDPRVQQTIQELHRLQLELAGEP